MWCTGSCWIYDNSGLAYSLIGLVVVLKFISMAMNILAIKLYKAPDSITEITETKEYSTEDNSTQLVQSVAWRYI